MSHYTPSGLFVEDFSDDFEDFDGIEIIWTPECLDEYCSFDGDGNYIESDESNDWDSVWAVQDFEEYESYYQEEAGDLPTPEEVNAQVEAFLKKSGIPQLNGSHLEFFNAAREKADSLNISVWKYLGLDCPY